MKLTHRSTMLACYNGYITQAISINLTPLLYLTFQREFLLTLSQISLLIVCNFAVQLTVDLLASFFGDRIHPRACLILAHLLVVVGLTGLCYLPLLFPPFSGLALSAMLLGAGGGLTEVLISPLLEACPTEGKSGNMSLLHSFYSWGQAGVILLSGLYFFFFDPANSWMVLPFLWAIPPLIGAVVFCFVPIYRLPAAGNGGGEQRRIFCRAAFWGFLLIMLCGGASELVMSEWASSFAESGLGISKSLGDLLGPGSFALMMGVARLMYGKFSNRLPLGTCMIFCSGLCIFSYLLVTFSPHPVPALIGCALCGFSVGIFWPGTLSLASEELPGGGVAIFALLALAGDLGCLLGPALAGDLADAFGGDLRAGFGFALVFPTVGLIFHLLRAARRKKK